MSEAMMDRARFERIVEAYGAEPAHWPAAERAGAEAFLATHAAELVVLMAQARETDALLDAAHETAAPSDLLAARVLKKAPRATAPMTWRPLAALAACAVFGLVLGFAGGRLAPAADSADDNLNAALSALFTGGEG